MSTWLENEAARLFGEDVHNDRIDPEFRPAVEGTLHAASQNMVHNIRLYQRFGFAENARLAREWNKWATLDRHYMAQMDKAP